MFDDWHIKALIKSAAENSEIRDVQVLKELLHLIKLNNIIVPRILAIFSTSVAISYIITENMAYYYISSVL